MQCDPIVLGFAVKVAVCEPKITKLLIYEIFNCGNLITGNSNYSLIETKTFSLPEIPFVHLSQLKVVL